MNTENTILSVLFMSISLSLYSTSGAQSIEENSLNRQKRLFNVFQIVRFPNDPCVASGSRNGTCYTEAECESKSGVASGSCAAGFGVCCIFNRGCGASSNENCTFFEVASGSIQSGPCAMEICRCNTNICQLRLDFNTFVIAGPSTSTVPITVLLNGQPSNIINANENTPNEKDANNMLQQIQASLATRCLTDTFAVTNPGGPTTPVICGTNTGEHMYVDASEECNTLDFNFGSATTTSIRQFSIKVTQVSCDSELLPPEGCTQFFYGSTTDTVQTYNFDNGNGLHLANQNQAICIRQERGSCRICWSAMTPTDFKVSGPDNVAMGYDVQENCCRYGLNGLNTQGYDCLIIHGAEKVTGVTNKGNMHEPSRVCGRSEGLIGGAGTATTLCSTTTPFMIRFNSDNFEFTGPMGANPVTREAADTSRDIGFRLAYIQDNIRCFDPQ